MFIIPMIILFILMLKGLSLEGSYTGLITLFTPDPLNLINPLVWTDAGI